MMQSRLVENLNLVKGRIEAAAIRSGRVGSDVTLVAVTKYVDLATTKLLVEAGQIALGESRPQVLWDKAEGLNDLDIQWHMIGHLQRNKVDRTLPLCSLIHSVDSIRLLKAIASSAEKARRTANCLLEVNISGEANKYGFQPDELESVLAVAAELKEIRVGGLMGMASLSGGLDDNRKEFARLREMRERLSGFQTDNVELLELSMGMSGDFEQAIEEGATIVRVGSVLFDGI